VNENELCPKSDARNVTLTTDPPPRCIHPRQVAAHVGCREDGYLTSTYHCLECGGTIVRTYKDKPLFAAPARSSPSLSD